MSLFAALPVVFLYPLSLLGDGCTLVAIALAATLGGNPKTWGASFAFFHAFYAILGVIIATELTEYSEVVGDIFVTGGAFLLLRHILHHRLKHTHSHHDCGCDHTPPANISYYTIVSTTAVLSFHALAAGAVVQKLVGPIPTSTLIPLLVVCSTLVGLCITIVLSVEELERSAIIRIVDRTPGVFSAITAAICSWTLYHAVDHAVGLSGIWTSIFWLFSVSGVLAAGYVAHERRVHAG